MSVKFCKDCKWCDGAKELSGYDYSRCLHFKTLMRTQNLVSGVVTEKQAIARQPGVRRGLMQVARGVLGA